MRSEGSGECLEDITRRCLDVTSTHKPTMWHSDPHHTSTQHFVHCDNFLLRHFDHVTFFYCDIPTLWQFSTVTLGLCDIFLLWHSDSVTIFYCDIPSQSGQIVRPPQKVDVCHTVTFRPTVILANPWLWHFVHFGFPFLPSIPCQSCRRIWQMMISWHCPINFWTPHTDSGGWDLALITERGCFFDYFSDPTARLEATATFSSLPRGDSDHCDILSTPPWKKLPGGSPVTCDKTSTFRFRAKVDVLSQSR